MNSEDLRIKFKVNNFSDISDCSMSWELFPVVDTSCPSPAPPGGHPGFCQSLQRHLCVLGVRLPVGPHLPDTSLLLGRHQSQLPREQLCLGDTAAAAATTAVALLEGQTRTFYLFFFLFLLLTLFCWFSSLWSWAERDGGVSELECVRVCISVRAVIDGFYCMFGERSGGWYAWCFSF